ncbi:PrsW family glutamic-type intramembrane protease [Sphingomonas xanthus]|uniref:PrsW family intramembrane metalloprotease n=1 Tax=Sphingomonas xanthus TaxID=2594473 RepID=A0A516ISI5_9SPHN|nr:PrsW family glutamic-type intramembrane protease [Sphingomonas xanthus]QDP19863.1 PrsW family intramembrane metalloprotease [Sphingomonas xanthus]
MIFELTNWSVALAPVLVMLMMFIWLDVFKLMTGWETIGLLALGGMTAGIAYPVSGVFLDQLPLGYSSYSRFAAPWIEELIKGLAIVGLFYFNRIGFKLDAVISGFAIGAGFSVVENIIYLTRFPDLAPTVWMVRGLGTAVMHGCAVAILAATAHEFAERETRGVAAEFNFSPLWFAPGYLGAVAVHTLFNQFPNQPMLAMIATVAAAPFLIMTLLRFGAIEAQKWLATEREAHRIALDRWRAGRYPDSDSGRKIAALVARSDPKTGESIREYCEQLTFLAWTAEDALHDQLDDVSKVEVEAGAAFDRLEALRHAIGKASFAALKPLLPLSRNDYWEISELEERLKAKKAQPGQ